MTLIDVITATTIHFIIVSKQLFSIMIILVACCRYLITAPMATLSIFNYFTMRVFVVCLCSGWVASFGTTSCL